MPAHVKVIRAREFVRATPDGAANLESAAQLLQDIARAGRGLEDYEVLVDIREVSGRLSASDIWMLTEKLVRLRESFARRTAILCPLERFDHARFFALCAENKGFNIQAFTSSEDAMEWLIAN